MEPTAAERNTLWKDEARNAVEKPQHKGVEMFCDVQRQAARVASLIDHVERLGGERDDWEAAAKDHVVNNARLVAELEKARELVDWALGVIEKAQEACHGDWCSGDDHAAFCDYLTESLAKARAVLEVKS